MRNEVKIVKISKQSSVCVSEVLTFWQNENRISCHFQNEKRKKKQLSNLMPPDYCQWAVIQHLKRYHIKTIFWREVTALYSQPYFICCSKLMVNSELLPKGDYVWREAIFYKSFINLLSEIVTGLIQT